MRKAILLLLPLLLVLGACDGSEDKKPPEGRTVNVTTIVGASRDVEVIERVVGRILDPAMVTVAAEVPARVVRVLVAAGDKVRKGQLLAELDDGDYRTGLAAAAAEIGRLEAQIKAQKRLVQRYRKLAGEKFVSPTMLDQAEADLAALQKSLRAAGAKHDQAGRDLARTKVRAPIAGRVQQRLVAAGDYAKAGAPLFALVAGDKLQISLPVPETKSSLIRVGQEVRLHLPGDAQVVHNVIRQLKPMVSANAAFEARVDVAQPGGWRPGGSVVAEIVVARHRQAVVVPEASVVLRPVGEVVYVIAAGKAQARRVKTGAHVDGMVEITAGLAAGEVVAVDGAAFLADGAAVHIKEQGV